MITTRRTFTWTRHQLEKIEKVQVILKDLEDYKPLTLRQIYYQLVGRGFIENNVSQYQMLSKLLKHARLEGAVPWEDIEDRVRTYHDLTGWHCSGNFTNYWQQNLLTGYSRDLMQGQEAYLEIWIEKDALSRVFTNIAQEYTVPVVVCRGFSSVSFLNDYRNRLKHQKGREPVLLYFGDFDPSGVEMLKAMQVTFREELGLDNIQACRIALQAEDIDRYNLPHTPEAIKAKDTRTKRHTQLYGELAVELDALPPDILSQKIREAIEQRIDLDNFYNQQHQEQLDQINIDQLKQGLQEFIRNY
jgi:hypothetical protein